jgi:MFS family permease
VLIRGRFFFHERVRYTNLWVFCLLGGPFLGPFIAAWLIQAVSWRADYGVLAALHALSTILVVVFGDETLYDRFNPQKRQTGLVARVKLLIGITGHKAQGRPSPWRVVKDLLVIQIKPQIFFITVIYVMVLVAWVIGVNTTVSQLVLPPLYSFSATALAASWVAPMIGAVIGGLWGDWFNSWLQARYIRIHAGAYVVENRLWGTYAPTIIGFTGLVLYGQTLQHSMHWIGLLIAWSFIAFAMASATTEVSAYCLDSFPNHAALVAAIVNMWR